MEMKSNMIQSYVSPLATGAMQARTTKQFIACSG